MAVGMHQEPISIGLAVSAVSTPSIIAAIALAVYTGYCGCTLFTIADTNYFGTEQLVHAQTCRHQPFIHDSRRVQHENTS
jgi:hypothetical protein